MTNRKKLEDFNAMEADNIVPTPEVVEDPGEFIIPAHFGDLAYNCLCDLGSSVNIMPISISKELGMGDLVPSEMHLILADRSITHPLGIIKNVPVKVGKFCIPGDFVILDMEVKDKTPIILGRGFLATVGAIIDVKNHEMTFTIGDEKINFKYRKEHVFNVYIEKPPDPIRATCFTVEVDHGQDLIIEDDVRVFKDIKVQLHDCKKRSKKRDWRSEELEPGDTVKVFHSQSAMFPGTKATRWSGPYNVTKVHQDGSMGLWHKNGEKLKVHRNRVKLVAEPDPVKRECTDPPDSSI